MPGSKNGTQLDKNEVQRLTDEPIDSGRQVSAETAKSPLADQESVEKPGVTEDVAQEMSRGPDSLEGFLRYAYDRNGQRLALGNSSQKRIATDVRLSEQTIKNLLELASEDKRLAVPPQLLLTSLSIDTYPILKNAIRDFVGDVLSRHIVFKIKGLDGVIHNIPEAPTEDDAIRQIAGLNRNALKEMGFGESLTGPKATEIRRNALNSLFLWLMVSRSRNVDSLIRRAFSEIWSPAASKVRDDAEKVRRILAIKDPTSLGLVGRHFQQQLVRADKEMARLERLQHRFSSQVTEITNEKESAIKEIAELKNSLAQIRAEFSNLESKSESDQIHQQDSYEQLRGRLLGRLKSEADLLEEGLHALRQPKPRVSVMDDHAERVLERIRKEIKRMESEER